MNSEGVGLIVRQLVSKISNICFPFPDPPMSQMDRQTDGWTDGQTTCDRNTVFCTIVHRAVIKLKEIYRNAQHV